MQSDELFPGEGIRSVEPFIAGNVFSFLLKLSVTCTHSALFGWSKSGRRLFASLWLLWCVQTFLKIHFHNRHTVNPKRSCPVVQNSFARVLVPTVLVALLRREGDWSEIRPAARNMPWHLGTGSGPGRSLLEMTWLRVKRSSLFRLCWDPSCVLVTHFIQKDFQCGLSLLKQMVCKTRRDDETKAIWEPQGEVAVSYEWIGSVEDGRAERTEAAWFRIEIMCGK